MIAGTCCMCGQVEMLFLQPFGTQQNFCNRCLCIFSTLLEPAFMRPGRWLDDVHSEIFPPLMRISRSDLGLMETIYRVSHAVAKIYEEGVLLRHGTLMQRLESVALVADLVFGDLR